MIDLMTYSKYVIHPFSKVCGISSVVSGAYSLGLSLGDNPVEAFPPLVLGACLVGLSGIFGYMHESIVKDEREWQAEKERWASFDRKFLTIK